MATSPTAKRRGSCAPYVQGRAGERVPCGAQVSGYDGRPSTYKEQCAVFPHLQMKRRSDPVGFVFGGLTRSSFQCASRRQKIFTMLLTWARTWSASVGRQYRRRPAQPGKQSATMGAGTNVGDCPEWRPMFLRELRGDSGPPRSSWEPP